ncbi:hypothetical protein AAMO2058_001196500 [Amorphochlora amoebiformis]
MDQRGFRSSRPALTGTPHPQPRFGPPLSPSQFLAEASPGSILPDGGLEKKLTPASVDYIPPSNYTPLYSPPTSGLQIQKNSHVASRSLGELAGGLKVALGDVEEKDKREDKRKDKSADIGSVRAISQRDGREELCDLEVPKSIATSRSMEDDITLVEDVLHPEMLEALEHLKTYETEEEQLIKVLQEKIVDQAGALDSDLAEALNMEIQMRKGEKLRIWDQLKALEEAKNKHMQELISNIRTIRKEHQTIQKKLELKKKREEGNYKLLNQLDIYDWVVDITLLSDLASSGWRVSLSKAFDAKIKRDKESKQPKRNGWEGAVVGVVGLYDKGKTFVLNQITQADLPSGKKVSTKGLSFKNVEVEHTNFVLLDSAGSYSPVKVIDDLSVAQKEATEMFLMDLIFDLSDYFVCVVNDFTSLDQRYLDKLMRLLQNSNKTFQEVIVVHNLKEVINENVLTHIWKTQVTHIYADGSNMKTMVAARNEETGKLEHRQVSWFKTKFSRHVCLANHDSPLGKKINPWATSLLRYWLKSVFVPVDRDFTVVETVVQSASKRLSAFIQQPVHLRIYPGEDDRTMYIKPDKLKERGEGESKESIFTLPQIALDATGLMLARPDSFLPPVDILRTPTHYHILLDIPGMRSSDISLSRTNVITIIKGKRSIPYDRKKVTVIKQERRYGEFTLTFNIPQIYERKWETCEVEEGVLWMRFRRDTQDPSAHPLPALIAPNQSPLSTFSKKTPSSEPKSQLTQNEENNDVNANDVSTTTRNGNSVTNEKNAAEHEEKGAVDKKA